MVRECPRTDFQTDDDGLDWFYSSHRDEVRTRLATGCVATALCARCASFGIVPWLRQDPPFRSIEELSDLCERRYTPRSPESAPDSSDTFRTLGAVETLEYRRDCSLCVCLFDLTPNPHSEKQVVTLVRSWTLFRMDHHFAVNSTKRVATSKHVTAVLEPPQTGVEVHRVITIESDGLVIAQQRADRVGPPLGSVRLDPTTIDLDSVKRWLQISIMSEIYRGSFATIIALSGHDANAGLSRVSQSSLLPQSSCTVDGVTLLNMGPTLEQLLCTTKWDERAWTYQEARLSPRCILVSEYGLYFECNSMHCMESLDDTNSPLHDAQKDALSRSKGTYTQRLNLGILRNPAARPVAESDIALNIYSLLAREYSHRRMTHASDKLLAFSGMLQVLREMVYADGFLWGLPLRHLNWAMAWQANSSDDPRNENFPTWTWLSNMGQIWPGGPSIGTLGAKPEACSFDLELSIYHRPSPSQRFEAFGQSSESISPAVRDLLPDDPLSQPLSLELRGDFDIPRELPESQYDRLLFFESFAFTFAVNQRWEEEGNDWQSFFTIDVAGHELSGITTCDPESSWDESAEQLWLLLTRHIEERLVLHNMILLKREGDCFYRADMLRLEVPLDKLWLLGKLGLHRLRGTLI
ncbi:hypothetical protein LTR53_005788 [Teratosphaeriaceae sp. CCFEE 6253]|nr:hypothetical protein LTR53_005788 [Teratosphaeriaceae sp. CCFEE 6253]